VAERFHRCGRVGNVAEEFPALPRGPGRCFRVWNGDGEPAAVFYGYNTIPESVMLPETLRHRYRHGNFKDFRGCLTLRCGSPRVSKGDMRMLDVSPLLTRGLLHYVPDSALHIPHSALPFALLTHP